MDKKLVVGIADMKIAREEGMLITYALGSCLGICLYDPLIRLAALVHVMLPLNMEASRRSPLKYADTGIPGDIAPDGRTGRHAQPDRGQDGRGSRMFDVPGSGNLGNIGQRNIESAIWFCAGRACACCGRT